MIKITRIAKTGGPLTKRIGLRPDGSLASDGSACVMSRGSGYRESFKDLEEFADFISLLKSNEAITLGQLRSDLPDQVNIVTKQELNRLKGNPRPGVIARTADQFEFATGDPVLALLDIDTKGMPNDVRSRIEKSGGLWPALCSVLPELADAGHVVRRSTSSGLSRADTGAAIAGSDGLHVFVLVKDGSDISRFLRTFHDRCWLRGLAWMVVSTSGQLLDRSLIDRMVATPERLVFEGPPILAATLVRDPAIRRPTVHYGTSFDSRAKCRDLSLVERARMGELRNKEALRLAQPAAKAKAASLANRSSRLSERLHCPLPEAERLIEQQFGGILLPEIPLPFDEEQLFGTTVAQVLADPEQFVDATLADPIEGVDYGRCKAKIMRRADGSLWINSFAHGRTTYELKHDAVSIEAMIERASVTTGAGTMARWLSDAELNCDEEQRLRDLIVKKTGVGLRSLNTLMKTARVQRADEHAQEARASRAGHQTDQRLCIQAPPPDGERLPIMQMLDEVFGSTEEDEPPMRDLNGRPVEVRAREPLALHELTAAGANQQEARNTRLPPPSLPLLTMHNSFSMSHIIEGHVRFTKGREDDCAVALNPLFVEHYMNYRDSTLPRVGAVVTAPLVLMDGTLLSSQGLDRQRRLVFRIEAGLLSHIPQTTPSNAKAAAALQFLTEEWLCDVSTDFVGKCILIAMALTILERVLLPERPAFFVTAGKRGGGKTTALTMVNLAVTGRRPPAAAWSFTEEERRKAMLAHLAEGLPSLVWDNIPSGATISCSILEKVLTGESYSDRVLGQTAILTVPCLTVMAFTGNNIKPKDDLVGRILETRLDVDRPDPENRKFKHGDPINWTLDNRGKIMRAFYVVLLANKQLRQTCGEDPKTRFKIWWHLVGSAVENAVQSLITAQSTLPIEKQVAVAVDFTAIFAATEAEDEETRSLIQVLDILRARWPGFFRASDIALFVNEPPADGLEDAAALRSFFDPSGRRIGLISSIVAGRRLAAAVEAPVWSENVTLKLVKSAPANQSEQRKTTWFSVRVTDDAAK